jgi:hypothetical protein
MPLQIHIQRPSPCVPAGYCRVRIVGSCARRGPCERRFLSRCLALVYDGCRRESGLQVARSGGQKSSSPLLLLDVAEGPSERTGGNRAIRNQFTPASVLANGKGLPEDRDHA